MPLPKPQFGRSASDATDGQAPHRPEEGAPAGYSDPEALRVQRAQAGDAAAWDEWFTAYYRPLYRYAYFRLRSRAEVEDVVAQVFVEAYRGIGRYRYTGKPLLAWLYRIAHNLVSDRLKAASRRPEQDPVPADDDLEACLVSLDLLDALDCLTPEQHDVIVMRYFMGMSSLEVGKALGKTQPAVFSLQARALATLREKLKGALEP